MLHLTIQQREGYQDGTLEMAEEYLAIDAHLADCAACRDSMQSPSPAMPGRVRSLLTDEAHPDAALIARYARDNSGVPVMVAQHVAACAQCRQDVAGLQVYQRVVTPEIWVEARAALETPGARPGFGEWLRVSFRAAGSVRAFRVGIPVVAVCLLLLCVFLWRSQRVIEITDGSGRWALTRGGQMTGPISLPPELQPLVREALQNRSVETPQSLASLEKPANAGYSPTGTFVRSDLPQLRWEALSDAVSYRCTLTSPDDPNFKRGAPKPISGTSWKLKKPLPRGKIYTWQVVATLRSGRRVPLSGSPRFKVLEQTQAEALAQASKTVAGSHLTLGLLYARAGVLDESEQEFDALLRANPDSETIKTLLNRIRALHHPIS
jgi:hypothetical protein